MKKIIEFKQLFIAIAILSILIIPSCKKDTEDIYNSLKGIWVSTDLIDTVDFRTDHDFYKTVGVPRDHFNYSVSQDSMTIQYNGSLYILIHPSKHIYTLKHGILTIDLSNGCYGFRDQIITFSKKQ